MIQVKTASINSILILSSFVEPANFLEALDKYMGVFSRKHGSYMSNH